MAKSYQCEQCPRVLKTKRKYQNHLNVHEEKFRCENCGKCFQDQYCLTRHKRGQATCEKILNKSQFCNVYCNLCDFKTTSKDNLRQHLVKHSGKIICSVCKQPFSRRRDLERHQKNPDNCNKYLFSHPMKGAAATVNLLGQYSPFNKNISITTFPSSMMQTIEIPIQTQRSTKKTPFI